MAQRTYFTYRSLPCDSELLDCGGSNAGTLRGLAKRSNPFLCRALISRTFLSTCSHQHGDDARSDGLGTQAGAPLKLRRVSCPAAAGAPGPALGAFDLFVTSADCTPRSGSPPRASRRLPAAAGGAFTGALAAPWRTPRVSGAAHRRMHAATLAQAPRVGDGRGRHRPL
jgi:hypothetical protein